jgi:hypothetical protein
MSYLKISTEGNFYNIDYEEMRDILLDREYIVEEMHNLYDEVYLVLYTKKKGFRKNEYIEKYYDNIYIVKYDKGNNELLEINEKEFKGYYY